MSYAGAVMQDNWAERSRIVAAMIAPGAAVVDYGCGTAELRKWLPKGCSYVGIDTVDFDFNSGHWPHLPHGDTAVWCGVLEWLNEPLAALGRMEYETVIVTYDFSVERDPNWKSNVHKSILIASMQGRGYSLSDRARWNGQCVMKFQR